MVKAIHSAPRNRGSADGAWGEQHEADMVAALCSGPRGVENYSRYGVTARSQAHPVSDLCDLMTSHQLERSYQRRVVQLGHSVRRAGLHQLRGVGRLRQCDTEFARALQC